MKTSSLLAALLFFVNSIFAQDYDFTSYGSATMEEIKMTECSFDKSADAIVLVHEAISDYNSEYQLVTYHHVRIKIFNKKGIDAANIKIPYWVRNDFERITKVEGMTINSSPGGEQTKHKIDRKSIYDQKVTVHRGVVTFTFPSIVPGSIIDYKYQSTMNNYGGLDEWVFQEDIPVLISKYRLAIAPNIEFAYRVNKRDDMDITVQPDNDNGRIYFEMKNIPALLNEPFMDSRGDYLQKVIFQLSGYNLGNFSKEKYMTSWDEVIKELLLDKDFGDQIYKNIPGSSELLRSVKDLPDEEKLTAIYNYVRGNFNWNNIYSKYALSGLKSVWQKKQGTSGEINLLLVNLLKESGIDAYPMLVSERFHGSVNPAYPFLEQFNSTFVYAVINDKKYYLDATDPFTPVYLIPYDILNTTALVVNRKKGGIISIKNDALGYEDDIQTTLDIGKDGNLKGDVKIKSKDYARVTRTREYKSDKDDFMREYFSSNKGDLQISGFKWNVDSTDAGLLHQQCDFRITGQSDINFLYVPLDLFSGFKSNPFIADERFSNINFGYKRRININTNVAYSPLYTIEAMPKSVKFVSVDRDIIISREIIQDTKTNTVRCNITCEFANGLYQANQYLLIKEMYKKMFALLEEPLVLKKK